MKTTKPKISIESQIVKVEAFGTVLHFKINAEEQKVALHCPSDSYLSPLTREIEIKNHKQFIDAYEVGIAYAERILKASQKKVK